MYSRLFIGDREKITPCSLGFFSQIHILISICVYMRFHCVVFYLKINKAKIVVSWWTKSISFYLLYKSCSAPLVYVYRNTGMELVRNSSKTLLSDGIKLNLKEMRIDRPLAFNAFQGTDYKGVLDTTRQISAIQ